MAKQLSDKIRGSASWAAYGDALGFITELTGRSGLRRRLGAEQVEKTQPWKRRIGGRGGPTVTLPAGAISDDTQLRLASSRAIRGDGEFDVELFSKVELTTFPAYAMGAGRGTISAAAALKRRSATWVANFFDDGGVRYVNGGGNGAAMRIQPHAWHTVNDKSIDRMVLQVVSNSVCTHGHPRGIVGAVFHALCVREAVRSSVPDPSTLTALAEELGVITDVVRADPKLGALWETQWERESKRNFDSAVEEVVLEIIDDIQRASHMPPGSEKPIDAYKAAVDRLGATTPQQRGSGAKTSILGSIAAWLFRSDPLQGIQACANELGTDTDSIATMAGAILGPDAGAEIPGPVSDLDYVLFEADRMATLADSHSVGTFPYPDLLGWTMPKAAADCVGFGQDGPHLAGLGPAHPGKEESGGSGKSQFTWQWLDLWFGQRILAKRRPHPKSLPSSQQVQPSREYINVSLWEAPEIRDKSSVGSEGPSVLRRPSMHELTDQVIASNFDPETIGRALLSLSEGREGIEDSVSFVSIIAKARKSRSDRGR
jgi:ADP-ribosylglycohydrolase